VGRAAEIHTGLSAASGLTICGPAGVGKTVLALVLAQQLKTQFVDAQFFIAMGGLGDQPVTPAQVLTHILRAYLPLERLPDEMEALQTRCRGLLAGQRVLLLLDDAGAAEQVLPLLPLEGVGLLITSQADLALPG
jgi:predicted ATPase